MFIKDRLVLRNLTNYCILLAIHGTPFSLFKNVWAETEYVGCAVAYCTPLQGFSWPSAYYYVCNYGIG